MSKQADAKTVTLTSRAMPDGLPARKEDIHIPLETPKIEEKTRSPESGEHGGKECSFILKCFTEGVQTKQRLLKKEGRG